MRKEFKKILKKIWKEKWSKEKANLYGINIWWGYDCTFIKFRGVEKIPYYGIFGLPNRILTRWDKLEIKNKEDSFLENFEEKLNG